MYHLAQYQEERNAVSIPRSGIDDGTMHGAISCSSGAETVRFVDHGNTAVGPRYAARTAKRP